jgi:hypothetical protein
MENDIIARCVYADGKPSEGSAQFDIADLPEDGL